MGIAFSEELGIVTTDENFQDCGKTPILMLRLKIMATGLAMLSAVSLIEHSSRDLVRM